MSQKNTFKVAMLLMAVIFIGAAAISESKAVADTKPLIADRYYIRVTGCDDGGRAYVNKTQVVEVGFGEDSRWLDVTEDLTKKDNKIKFEVINKTGAITYIFQVRRNDSIVYDESCGTAGMYGCEDNRAFRIGVARDFTYSIDIDN